MSTQPIDTDGTVERVQAHTSGQDALDAARYRFLRDQYEGRSYTTDSGPRPSTAESRVAYAIKNFGERTLDMIEIRLLCHHLGPREEPFWTHDDHFDYGRNIDAAVDAAITKATGSAT